MKERSYGVEGEGEEIVFFKDKRRKKIKNIDGNIHATLGCAK